MGGKKAALFAKKDRNSKYAIIFVHGLHGDADGTWRQSKHSRTLPELFALDEKLNTIDVYSFGYPSNLVNHYDFRQVSKILNSEIKAHLIDKDIIFITHSMGGLVTQQYLIDQYEQFNNSAVEHIKGIVYLAVPMNGSWLAKFASWFVPYHMQIKSLIANNPLLKELQEKWVKYVFRGGQENLPVAMRYSIPQLAMYGVRDRTVSKESALPFHVGADVIASDTGHKDICKIDQHCTEYKHLIQFISDNMTTKTTSAPMIVHVHGWDKQGYQEEAHYQLNWSNHFETTPSLRKLPSVQTWKTEILPQVESLSKEWSEKWAQKGGSVRIYAKLCLTGALLIGTRLSCTKGVKLEVVDKDGTIWTASTSDSNYKPIPKTTDSWHREHTRAVLILSVTKDIQAEVEKYLLDQREPYKRIVNLLPPNGAGSASIKNSVEALSYAISVKKEIEQLKTDGIEEIFLFLSTSLIVAFFVGHRLTASCPIQTFEFYGKGYVPATPI